MYEVVFVILNFVKSFRLKTKPKTRHDFCKFRLLLTV